jgi:cytochrome c-type biogenesis protein CcmH/NrfG
VYNADLVLNLCRTITREKDAQKCAELLALLRAVMREDQEEIRVRMAFLAKNYSLIGSESQAAVRGI